MEFNIIEKTDDTAFYIDRPLVFRLKLEIQTDDKLVLTKQYFKSGFSDNESYEKWWINKSDTHLNSVSIITLKFEDDDYMKELEYKIFELYYYAYIKLTSDMEKAVIYYNSRMKKIMKYQNEISYFVDKFNRRRKIIKIKNLIK